MEVLIIKLQKLNIIPYLFILPALIFYLVFSFIPLLGTAALSLTDWNGYNFNTISFYGIGNYIKLLNDPIFWQSFQNNVYFLFGSVFLQITLALIVALILDQNPPFSKFIRGIYFMPSVMSMVVLGLVFSLVLSPSFGIVNPILNWFGFETMNHDWLGSSRTAMPTLILIQMWFGFGFSMFIFIAKLQSIPMSLYEAAKVDGATKLQEILHITLPSLRETMAVVIMLAMINSMKIFALPYVMTGGGPNHATEVLSTWSYFKAFNLSETGYGSAVATTVLIITFILTYFQFKLSSLGREDS